MSAVKNILLYWGGGRNLYGLFFLHLNTIALLEMYYGLKRCLLGCVLLLFASLLGCHFKPLGLSLSYPCSASSGRYHIETCTVFTFFFNIFFIHYTFKYTTSLFFRYHRFLKAVLHGAMAVQRFLSLGSLWSSCQISTIICFSSYCFKFCKSFFFVYLFFSLFW